MDALYEKARVRLAVGARRDKRFGGVAMLEPRVCCRTTQSSQKAILRGITGRGVQAHALGGTECGAARLCEAVKRIVGADRRDRIG